MNLSLARLKTINHKSTYRSDIGVTHRTKIVSISPIASEQRSKRVRRLRVFYYNLYKNNMFLFFYFQKNFNLENDPLYFYTSELENNISQYQKIKNNHPYIFNSKSNSIVNIKSHRIYINIISYFTKLYILYNEEDKAPHLDHEDNIYHFHYLNEINGEKIAYKLFNNKIHDARTCEVLYKLTQDEIISLNIEQSTSAFVLKTKLNDKNLYLILSYNITDNIVTLPDIDPDDFTNREMNLKNLIINDSPLFFFNYFNVPSGNYDGQIRDFNRYFLNNFQTFNDFLQQTDLDTKENTFYFKFLQDYNDIKTPYKSDVYVTMNTRNVTTHVIPQFFYSNYDKVTTTNRLQSKVDITFLYETHNVEKKNNYDYLKTIESMAWRDLTNKKGDADSAVDAMWARPLRKVQMMRQPTFPKPTKNDIKNILIYFTITKFPEVIDIVSLYLGFKLFNDRIRSKYTNPNNGNISNSNIKDIKKIITDKYEELESDRNNIEERLQYVINIILFRYYWVKRWRMAKQYSDSFIIDQCFALSNLVFNHINIYKEIFTYFETNYIIDYYHFLFKGLHFSTFGNKFSFTNQIPSEIALNLKNKEIYTNEIIYTFNPYEKAIFNEELTDLDEVNLCKVKDTLFYPIFNVTTKFDIKNISVFDNNEPYYFPFNLCSPKLDDLPKDSNILFGQFSYGNLIIGSTYFKKQLNALIDKFKLRANFNRPRYDITSFLNEIYNYNFNSLGDFIQNIIYVKNSSSIELPKEITLLSSTIEIYDEYNEYNPENNYTKILKYCNNSYYILYIKLLAYLYLDVQLGNNNISNEIIENTIININSNINNNVYLQNFFDNNNDDHIFKTFLTDYCYYFYIEVKYNKDVIYSQLYNYMLELNNMINVLNISTTYNILDLNIYKTILNTIKTVIKKISVDNNKIEFVENTVRLSDIMISKSVLDVDKSWKNDKWPFKYRNYRFIDSSLFKNKNCFASIKLYNKNTKNTKILYLSLNTKNKLCIYDKIIRSYDNNCILQIEKLNEKTLKFVDDFTCWTGSGAAWIYNSSEFSFNLNLFEIDNSDTYIAQRIKKKILEINDINFQLIQQPIKETYCNFTLETSFTKTRNTKITREVVIETDNFKMFSYKSGKMRFLIKTPSNIWYDSDNTDIFIDTNRLTLIHVTYMYGELKIYINGGFSKKIAIVYSKLLEISDNTIKLNRNDTNFIKFDYVKLYNYAFTENEITENEIKVVSSNSNLPDQETINAIAAAAAAAAEAEAKRPCYLQ